MKLISYVIKLNLIASIVAIYCDKFDNDKKPLPNKLKFV